MNSHTVGNLGEELAVDFLKENNHIVLKRNYRIRECEIDIVSIDQNGDKRFGIDKYVVFTEVKYRNDLRCGSPYEFVDYNKQKKIVRAARHFLLTNGYNDDVYVRFDVISIVGEQITWIKNAFDASF